MLEQKTYIKNHPYGIEERAKIHYGLTETFEFAGYILEDGSMLNFCYGGYQRDEDHRNIGFFYKKAQFTASMLKFMRRGNIRVCCNDSGYCFEALKKPTEKQINTLKRANAIARINVIPFRFEYKNKCFYEMTDYLFGKETSR